MAVTVKFNSSLKNYVTDNPDGITELINLDDCNLKGIIESFGIDFLDVGFCAINNRIVTKIDILKELVFVEDGDRVEVFSEMKGG